MPENFRKALWHRSVIRLNSCPLVWPINCPIVGFFPHFIVTDRYHGIPCFDAYPLPWSRLGTINYPLVQHHKKKLQYASISELAVSDMRQNGHFKVKRMLGVRRPNKVESDPSDTCYQLGYGNDIFVFGPLLTERKSLIVFFIAHITVLFYTF